MKKLLLFPILLISISSFSQQDVFWSSFKSETSKLTLDKNTTRESFPKTFRLFELNLEKIQLVTSLSINKKSNQPVIISLPNVDGQLEQFEIFEASNFDSELQARFPSIRAFSGRGITDKFATLKISISPKEIQTMIFRADKENEYIEPYSADGKVYAVFNSYRQNGNRLWNCSTVDKKMVEEIDFKVSNIKRSNSGELKTMRLAQSCNGEYAAFFGASTAGNAADQVLVLTAINATLTRCNGVYEKDLGLHLNLINQTTAILFYDPNTDPYSTLPNWNVQLQQSITNLIGNSFYDIGHMFGATGGGGNAGCIGCVCDDPVSTTDTAKGSGITSPGGANPVPRGDDFDIDYVVHEIGHQLGGTHTFSMTNEGTGTNMEVGSGVTIMGYAGITAQDVALHSIPIYHAVSISQIQANLSTKSCPVTTFISSTNATPVALAGLDYTIPKSTPFALTGEGTDANTNNSLTYCWEQYNNATSAVSGANSVAVSTKTVGPNWRSFNPTASKTRIFPEIATVMLNQTTTAATGNDNIKVEALSSVARSLLFRLTVRDNALFSATAPFSVGQTNFDDMIVTVAGFSGPFIVTSQNTSGLSFAENTTQTVTWNVASTAGAPVNCANVKISLSTDNGLTFSNTLLTSTPNSGSAVVTIPTGINSSDCRIKVEAVGNIFFNVNTQKFTITSPLQIANFGLQNFELFPNPNNGNFNVKFDSDSKNEIKIGVHDLRGREIFSKSFQNNSFFNESIELSGVQAGVYLFNIQDGDKKEVKKIIIE